MHSILTLDQPAAYRLRVLGNLSEGWSEHFGGMTITTGKLENGQGVTDISGTVADQASLHGMLRSIRDLGLPLILVEWISS